MRAAVIGLLFLCLSGITDVTGAVAQSTAAGPDSLVTAQDSDQEDGSWLTKLLKRYFGGSSQQGDELDGRAVEVVSRYAPYIGKTIEVVLVHQVERFDPYWDSNQGTSQQLLNIVTKPFQSYTKDRLIREYLLFERGQAVDPFLLADTERMLRELDFINDVRILVAPVMGGDNTVAVVVETRDKWPFGVTGNIKDVDRYEANLYFSNIGGYGVRLDNKAIYRGDMKPNLGYQGRLRKRNLRGSFIDVRLHFEDSWQELSRQAELTRTLVHPGIKWVGGGQWEYTDVRDNAGVPEKFELGDYWVGHAVALSRVRASGQSARPMLVPAARFRKKDYRVRPHATADTNSAFLNTRDYLAGVTYQRLKYYKTSYLFKMGETEDLPAGFTVKLSGGYQDREFFDRTSSFFQMAYLSVRNKGDIFMGAVDLGGYFHDYVVEDGSLNLAGVYITRLMGGERFNHRLYSVLTYTLAFNRNWDRALLLGNKTGLRGLDDNKVKGNQRVILKLESRVFTPWSLMGFRFMVFGYADVGAIGGEKDPLVQQKFYSSIGLGFRINNPDLVLPSTQLRFGIVNSVEESGFVLGFKIGGVDYPEIEMPGTKPGGFAFD
ncbi:MAG: hypothetical protein ABFS42_07740 [Candidatus Krumholzibacteriota bacterium]